MTSAFFFPGGFHQISCSFPILLYSLLERPRNLFISSPPPKPPHPPTKKEDEEENYLKIFWIWRFFLFVVTVRNSTFCTPSPSHPQPCSSVTAYLGSRPASPTIVSRVLKKLSGG